MRSLILIGFFHNFGAAAGFAPNANTARHENG
jgi:hypothetical protein